MKNIKKFLVLLILLVPFTVRALESNSNTNLEVDDKLDSFTTVFEDDAKAEKDVNGSTVVAGNNVISTNVVSGINMLFGNNVKYEGNSDYALIAGNILNLSGNINNDGFILGNIVEFDSNFNTDRDLFIFANSVTIQGNINRDITIYATDVKLDNIHIMGNATIYASTLEISSNADIRGVLGYNEDIKSDISTSALVGEIKLLEKLTEETSFKDLIYDFSINYAGVMVIFLALAFIVPGIFKKIEKVHDDFKFLKTFSLLGFGALLLIGIPIIIVILFTTVIGTSLAFLTILAYIIAIILTTIFSGYLLGYLIWKKFIKKENNILLIGLIGISIIILLNAIPIIGEYIAIISLMVGLGIILNLIRNK